MDNYAIAENFSLLSKLMDINGENSFKTKTYAIAAFHIEKLPEQLSETARDKIIGIKGIGESVGKKIMEMLNPSGEITLYQHGIEFTFPNYVSFGSTDLILALSKRNLRVRSCLSLNSRSSLRPEFLA